jgi:hypothetical protein
VREFVLKAKSDINRLVQLKMSKRIWTHQNLYMPLVGMENGAATLENSLAVS